MKLYKIEASGHDYLACEYEIGLDYSSLAIKICNRITGVGAKGLIVVKRNPLEMIIYNSLGIRIMMDDNALTCFLKYVSDKSINLSSEVEVLTGNGVMQAEIIGRIPFLARVNLGKPNFNNSMLYINDSLPSFGRIIRMSDKTEINTYSLSLGGVNTIVFIDKEDSSYLSYAMELCSHSLFKRKTIVSFVEVINKLKLRVRSFSAVDGELKSHYSGIAASVVAAHKLNLIKGKCHVDSGGNDLYVEIGKKDNVYLSASARLIFEADYKEEM